MKLTKLAISKINEIADSEALTVKTIRVKVTGGGCSGFNQELDFSNDFDASKDIRFDFQDNISLIVDELSYSYLENCEIDYFEDRLHSGFKFINPNVKSSCGCGSSVAF